jgi:hypothetical protein
MLSLGKLSQLANLQEGGTLDERMLDGVLPLYFEDIVLRI